MKLLNSTASLSFSSSSSFDTHKAQCERLPILIPSFSKLNLLYPNLLQINRKPMRANPEEKLFWTMKVKRMNRINLIPAENRRVIRVKLKESDCLPHLILHTFTIHSPSPICRWISFFFKRKSNNSLENDYFWKPRSSTTLSPCLGKWADKDHEIIRCSVRNGKDSAEIKVSSFGITPM